MAIFVDTSHLVATSSAELYSFAVSIGMRPERIRHKGTEREHFDLTPRRRRLAVAMGAKEITKRELINIIRAKRAAGRLPKKEDDRGCPGSRDFGR